MNLYNETIDFFCFYDILNSLDALVCWNSTQFLSQTLAGTQETQEDTSGALSLIALCMCVFLFHLSDQQTARSWLC